eukprot:gnl/Dysnectes_brevis/66_a83_4470.p1 GENE.gnl/Dysnectes_brevis/66_a83_4470~~gnl/Dysnectes_brevis/66_a83_4470.p1  ORF type:complete len:548 (+),score=229.47 gnl/Dysnectes_brevis/66_a83_4470:1512-3155(+)
MNSIDMPETSDIDDTTRSPSPFQEALIPGSFCLNEQITAKPLFRKPSQRIFANKSVDMSRVKAVGFDMDHTLLLYKPAFESLCYELIIERLISHHGYPKYIRKLRYDPSFPIRGLFIDSLTGNMLKIDEFSFVQAAAHGRQPLTRREIKHVYPDQCVRLDDTDDRYHLQSTFFALPFACLYADLCTEFEGRQRISDVTASTPLPRPTRLLTPGELRGMPMGRLSYQNLYEDIIKAMELLHQPDAELKRRVMEDPTRYLAPNSRLTLLLSGLRAAGKRVFLLTNSGFLYTDRVLGHLLGKEWRAAFDWVLTAARKPLFFTDKKPFRIVDPTTGTPLVGSIGERLRSDLIYAGGNITDLHRLVDIRGKHVLYAGDSIIGDVRVPRSEFWRTMLVIPEAHTEVLTMLEHWDLYERLVVMERRRRAELCGLELADRERPVALRNLQRDIEALGMQIDRKYNPVFGSCFTTSWAMTWLAKQINSDCDLYTSSATNLCNYPSYYMFGLQVGNRFLPHQMYTPEIFPGDRRHSIDPQLQASDVVREVQAEVQDE